MTEAILTKALELHSKIVSLKKEIDYIDKCIEDIKKIDNSIAQKPFINIAGKHLILSDEILIDAVTLHRYGKLISLELTESEFSNL